MKNSEIVVQFQDSDLWEMLLKIFLCHFTGDIKYAEIKTDGSGRSRGYGLVQFYNSDSARRAISMQFVFCSVSLNILLMLRL